MATRKFKMIFVACMMFLWAGASGAGELGLAVCTSLPACLTAELGHGNLSGFRLGVCILDR